MLWMSIIAAVALMLAGDRLAKGAAVVVSFVYHLLLILVVTTARSMRRAG